MKCCHLDDFDSYFSKFFVKYFGAIRKVPVMRDKTVIFIYYNLLTFSTKCKGFFPFFTFKFTFDLLEENHSPWSYLLRHDNVICSSDLDYYNKLKTRHTDSIVS